MVPNIVIEFGGTRLPLAGNPGVDPRKLYYTFQASSGLLTGWYGISGDVEHQFYYSSTGSFGANISVIELRPAPTVRHYQSVPEDNLSKQYQYRFCDNYPWVRPILAGGEEYPATTECSEAEPVSQVYVDTECYVVDEGGKMQKVVVVISGPQDRGYSIVQDPENDFGQRAIGFARPEAYPDQVADTDPVLSEVDEATTGIPYVVGAVKGVLVADPTVHWTPIHRNGLVAWFHLGEHPQQSYSIKDLSPYALVQSEVEVGAFRSNYKLENRVWDENRGWVLALEGKTPTEDAGFFSFTKSRLSGLEFTISFWVKPSEWLKDTDESAIFSYGPVTIKHGAESGEQYLVAYCLADGIETQLGSYVYLVENEFTFFWLSSTAIDPSRKTSVQACSNVQVDELYGLPEIDGVSLSPSDLVLLVNQDDAIENGCYSVSEGAWYRMASVTSFDEAGYYYNVIGGDSNQGIYRCTNTGTISYNEDEVFYVKINAEWSGSPTNIVVTSITRSSTTATATTESDHGLAIGTVVLIQRASVAAYNKVATITSVPTSTTFTYELLEDPGADATDAVAIPRVQYQALIDPFEFEDTEMTVSSPDIVNAVSLSFSDIRIWAEYRADRDIYLVAYPEFNRTHIAARPTFVKGTDGSNRTLQVLSSGYVFPGVAPIDYYTQLLVRSQRYNSVGEYVGPDHRLLTGYGDGKVHPSTLTLGYVGNGMTSAGRFIAASTSSNIPGDNDVWFADATTGFYRYIALPTVDPNSDNTALVANPASSYHPAEVPYQNPNQARIFVLGEDGNMYRVSVHVQRTGTTDIPSLYAKLAGRCETGALRPGITYLSDGSATYEVASSANFYDLVASYTPDELYKREFLSDAATTLSRSGVGRLAVENYAGVPTVVQLSDDGRDTPPIYLYSHFQNYLLYRFNESTLPWLNQDTSIDDYGIPTRALSGPLIFQGTDAEIGVGTYRMVIDATDIAAADSSFAGFKVELSISAYNTSGQTLAGSSIVKATLVPGGTSEFAAIYQYDGDVLTARYRLSNCTVEDFQAALDELDSLTGGITVLEDAPYPSAVAGPFWIQFNTVGAKPLLKFDTTSGLTVAVVRAVEGDGSTQEIQQVTFNRPLAIAEFNITTPIVTDSTRYWTIQIYLTSTATAPHRLAVHSLWFYKVFSQLYRVDPGTGGLNIEAVDIEAADGPDTKPGGFRAVVDIDGVVSHVHEKDIYAVSASAAQSTFNPDVPLAALLTGSTLERLDFIKFASGFQLADSELPELLQPITAVFSTGSPDAVTILGFKCIETFESYSVEDPFAQDLDGGIGWLEDGDILFFQDYDYDDFEPYTLGADLNGLEENFIWDGPYESRENYTGIQAYDDFESY